MKTSAAILNRIPAMLNWSDLETLSFGKQCIRESYPKREELSMIVFTFRIGFAKALLPETYPKS